MAKTRRTLLVVVAGALLLAGCTAQSASGPMQAVAPGNAAPGIGKSDSAAGAAQPPQPASSKLPPADATRQVVRTANLSLKSNNVGDALIKARKAATDAGGYSSDENSGGDHATLTLKVPSDKLDSVLTQLVTIGSVVSRTEHAEDVTQQVVDVDSRLAAQRASVTRVRALLDKATSIAEITSIESELTRREADLDSLQQRHDALAGQVALSTVSVDISKSDAAPPPDNSPTFLSGFGAGWDALVASLKAVSIAIGAVLPFAVLIGIPAFAVVWWIRRWRRSRPVRVPAEQ